MPTLTEMSSFTVVELIVQLGYEPEDQIDWVAGAELRRCYEEVFGQPPPKALRPKTRSRGSHCFAIYPPEFRVEATEIVTRLIGEMHAERGRQLGLF